MEQIDGRKDSYTIGTPAKGGSIKLYFDLATMTDDEVTKLVNRAKGLYILIKE